MSSSSNALPSRADVAALARDISKSKKYRHLSPETIVDVLSIELANVHKRKTALDRTRLQLHRILADYHGHVSIDRDRARLTRAFASGDSAIIRSTCSDVMSLHATARERLPLLEQGYYQAIFEVTGRPTSVLDVACALHPLGLRWMELGRSTPYRAFDNNHLFVDLVNNYLALEGQEGRAIWCDVLIRPAGPPADIAFLLNTYHCLEARRSGAGRQVLEATPAKWIIASLPTRNLGGKASRALLNRHEEIRRMARARGWRLEQLDWQTEVCFLINKAAG